VAVQDQERRRKEEFDHHGDVAIPGQQRFGGFARSLMSGLGLPIRNRFGLRPEAAAAGDSARVEIAAEDRHGILFGVQSLNVHPHLPHLERLDGGCDLLEILVKQRVAQIARHHPSGRTQFDAVLQSTPEFSRSTLIVADATLWSSASGGSQSLERLWRNVALAS